jgi:polysaccharide biosynthesis protein VpsM
MMKQHCPLALAALAATFAASAPQAHAFAEVARGKLVATARLAGSYDTNIFSNNTEVDDFTSSFTPGLNYTRDVGRISATAQLGVNAITFADTNGQDSLDPFINASFKHDRAEKGSDALSLGYARTTEANDLLLDRVESDIYRGNLRTDYFYSEKTGFRLDGGYRISTYDTAGYNDVESYTLGGGVLYRYSPKLVANATYSFNTELATSIPAARLSDPSSDNHRFGIGLEGELAPKLTGTVGVGYGYREFDVDGSDEALLFNAGLSWLAAEKTKVSLVAAQGFDTTANAESARTLDVTLGARQSLTEKISLNASIGYGESQLDEVGTPVSREDESYNFGLGASYSVNDHASVTTTLLHRINESTLARADYDRTVVSLGVNLTY